MMILFIMKIKKMMNKFLALLFLVFSFVSCSSIKEPSEVFKMPDYTEEDVRNNEIKRIAKIAETNITKALWRSLLLNDSELVQKYEDLIFEELKNAVAEQKFFDSWRLYGTLKTVGYSRLSELPVSEKQIFNSYLADVPGIIPNSKLLPKTIQNCIDATVTIWVDKGIAIQNGMGYADRVLGSGFFIDKRGYIITNHHVINDMVDPKYEGYSRLYIKLASDQDTRIPAKVVGYDSVIDLALLKVEIDPPFILALGSSHDLHIGDKVSAIGTPLGLHGTLTSGIVSAVDRKLFTSGNVLQIDTAVNSGNSGGPLIDGNLKVQAVVFAGIMQYQGLNFAIPVEYLRQDLPFLFNGGKREHVWVGAYGHTKREANKNLGLEVQYAMPGGVAFRAGLKKGDVITELNGIKIYTIDNAQDVFRNFCSGSIVLCKYLRDEKEYSAFLYLEKRPEQPGYEIYCSDLLSGSMIPILGMELTPNSTMSSKKYVISDILRGSVADESGFSVTDPVTIHDIEFSPEKDAISITLSTRKKKKGYLDVTMQMGASLDSPYYF